MTEHVCTERTCIWSARECMDSAARAFLSFSVVVSFLNIGRAPIHPLRTPTHEKDEKETTLKGGALIACSEGMEGRDSPVRKRDTPTIDSGTKCIEAAGRNGRRLQRAPACKKRKI